MRLLFTLFLSISAYVLSAQTNISGVVNTYAKVSSISGTTLTLSNIGGASTDYATFAVGQKIMIYQAKGASFNSTTTSADFGDVSSYNAAGLYEIRTITARSSNQITVASLSYTYNTSGLVQVVHIPEYTTANVTGTVTATNWSSSTGRGGIVALIANKLVLKADINANGKGFVGGGISTNDGSACSIVYATANTQYGAKGEGIAITSNNRAQANIGNGGGGGGIHNGGGGGGSNFGQGGKGGLGWPGAGCDATVDVGGFPGDTIDYAISSTRVFFGGGGGGGQQNNSNASAGANGGGLVLILADTITTDCSGTYGIYANGNTANDTPGNDGAGGGGAGGTVIINTNYYDPGACSFNVSASGGNGGNVNTANIHGGGGGGGTGPILSNIAPATNVNFSSTAGTNGSDCTTCTPATSTSVPGTSPAIDYTINQIVLVDGTSYYEGPAPGGVDVNLSVWLQANSGVTYSGGKVSNWSDITGRGNFAYMPTSSSQPSYVSNALNFNPAVSFDGNDDWLSGLGGFYTDEYWIIAIPNNTVNSASGGEIPLGFATDGGDYGWLGFGSVTGGLTNEVVTHGVGSFSSDWRRGVTGSYSISSGTPQIYLVQNNSTNTTSNMYINGKSQTLTTGSGPFEEGNNKAYYLSGFGGAYFDGSIAEMFSYSTRNGDANRRKIASYLAVKYGITLDQSAATTNDRNYYNSAGTIVWNQSTNSAYNNDVAGLAFDNTSGLKQFESKSVNSDAIIQMKVGNISTDLSYMFWSNNNAAITFSSFGSVGASKLARTWKITESGTVGEVEFKVSSSQLPASADGNYMLLVSTDPTFASGVTYYTLNAGTGDTLTASIDFENGEFFTFGTSSEILWTDNGWIGGSGSGFTPDLTDGTRNVYILSTKDTARIETQALVNNVIINSGTVLSVESAACLETNGTITNEGRLVVQDKGSLKQNTDSPNTGSGIYEVVRVGEADSTSYNYWSAPMSGIATSSFFAGSNIFSVYYNNPLQGVLYYSWVWAYVNHIMQIGRGYIAQGPAPFTGISNTRRFINSNINNGNYSINVQNNLVQSNPYNLLGNPYPSGLNVTTFLTDNSAVLEGTVWLWDHNAANPDHFLDTNYWDATDYAQYTAGSGGTGTALGGTVPDGVIGVAQGFFVQIKNTLASGTVNFTNSQRTCVNNQFFKPEGDEARLWLNVINSNYHFNQTLLAFVPAATSEFESFYDGKKLKGSSYMSLYSVIESGEELGIQGLESLDQLPEKGKVIPLGLDAWELGEYQFLIDATSTVPVEYDVILEDRTKNIFHDLRKGAYVLNIDSIASYQGRFFLNIALSSTTSQSTDGSAITTGIDNENSNSEFSAFVFDNTINVQSLGKSKITRVEVLDLTGRVLYNNENVNDYNHSINLNVAKSIKLLKVYTENNTIETFKVMY